MTRNKADVRRRRLIGGSCGNLASTLFKSYTDSHDQTHPSNVKLCMGSFALTTFAGSGIYHVPESRSAFSSWDFITALSSPGGTGT